MTINRKLGVLAAAAVGVLLVGGAASSPAFAQSFQFRFGTGNRPLSGRSFETMRALSHYLDQLAEHAATEAEENAHHGDADEASAIGAIISFANQASDFHERMDNYLAHPWDLPREIQDLDRQARNVNRRLLRGHFYEHVTNDWYQVLDTLDRMKRLLYGQDVDVPIARYQGRDYRRDYQPFLQFNFPGGAFYLEGSNLNSVRSDLHNLDVEVTRAHEVAEAAMNGRSNASQRFFERIHAFNDRTHELHRFSDMDRIDLQDLRPILQRLSSEARGVDQAMRQAHAIPEVWDEWAAVLQTLDRLMDEVRY
jgi:hypothetical protein